MITVLVINLNRREFLARCLESIRDAAHSIEAELLVVDNGSTDGSRELVSANFPEVQLVALDVNEGFAPAVVRATAVAAGDWLLLVNNDAWLESDAITQLLAAAASRPHVGAVTAQVRFAAAPDRVNTAGLAIDSLGIAYDCQAGQPVADAPAAAVEVFGASGCVSMYSMEMLAEIGGFDPEFFAFGEDADVAWRARAAGWVCLYAPRAIAYHVGSATASEGSPFKYDLVGANRVRLLAKNATLRHLIVWGWAMLLYDIVYVLYVLVADGTLAPLHGRIRGLRSWRAVRAASVASRRPVALQGHDGWRQAFAMRRAYARYAGLAPEASALPSNEAQSN